MRLLPPLAWALLILISISGGAVRAEPQPLAPDHESEPPHRVALPRLSPIVAIHALGPAERTSVHEAGSSTSESSAVRASLAGVGVAVLPGFLASGSGLWVAGDRVSAHRLFSIQAIGLGTAAISGTILATTGASRRVANATVPLLGVGVGLLLQSWLADIYGASGGGRRNVEPRLGLKARVPLAASSGLIYIRDPSFNFGTFAHLGAEFRYERLEFASELALGLGSNTQRIRGHGRYRFLGPGRNADVSDGTFLDLELGTSVYRYADDGFTTVTPSVAASGRLDLARLGPSLSGSFAELLVGYGIEINRIGGATDGIEVPLLRFSYGLYLGRESSAVRGEIAGFYDHRRDDFAGGLRPGNQAAGFIGSFGLAADLGLGKSRWSVRPSIEVGSALVTTLILRASFGDD